MDRRDTLKTLLIGSVAGGVAGSVTLQGCTSDKVEPQDNREDLYGRTPQELERDQSLFNEEFLSSRELETIAILCDIILPATTTAGSATEAGVHEFIDFIVKDMTQHQLPLRGGLMWLDLESNKRFNTSFSNCSQVDQLAIVEDIAYPDKVSEEYSHGAKFFDLMRDLTLTGYYTTKMGIDDLGYKGNVPNAWDGVPEEVLKDHNVEYDEEWISCWCYILADAMLEARTAKEEGQTENGRHRREHRTD